MKTSAILILALSSIVAFSCKKESQPASAADQLITSQKAIVTTNTWKVTLFTENGIDHSSDFNGYVFLFNSDGSVVVNNTISGVSLTGMWNVKASNNSKSDDSGHHEGSDDKNKLVITITGSHLMDEISDDLDIVKISESEMWLADDNTTSPKEIHFTRIQ